MECAPSQLVPQGNDIQLANQGCAIAGGRPGLADLSGDDYLGSKYDYSRANLWRNLGVVIAFSILYLIITIVATELLSFARPAAGGLVFKPTKRVKQHFWDFARTPDEEKPGSVGGDLAGGMMLESELDRAEQGQGEGEDLGRVPGNAKIFTWENINYSVSTVQGAKVILNQVSGYAKPGVMIALMGASGAGKTTLLNVLSQRKTSGTVSGEVLLDGRPLGRDFQRTTGYVEQMDLHEETATIREALEFSAVLRQSHTIHHRKKQEYVEKILNLLGLWDIQDAIIRSLSVDQKKRVTIGVELAASPSLIFLDEPTSGLDSQSAFSIVQFLRQLCNSGHAIVCTIHQPSMDLIQQFDMILALDPSGAVFYFGPVGDNGTAVTTYFRDRGTKCSEGKNVAEFLLETAAKGGEKVDGKPVDWIKEWRESRENSQLAQEIRQAKAANVHEQPTTITAMKSSDGGEFATPTLMQIVYLTKRMFIHQWREPPYIYGRLFTAFFTGIFNGFTFWQLGNTVADMQNRLFTSFLILLIPAAVLNSVLPKFFFNRALWEAREKPSRTYGWIAFCTAEVVSEIPSSLLAGILYWLLWYLPNGLPYDASTAGYVFLMTLLFFLFQSSWGQWICAWAPSFTVISNVLPFFLTVLSLFNGVVVPYSQLNVFWKYWVSSTILPSLSSGFCLRAGITFPIMLKDDLLPGEIHDTNATLSLHTALLAQPQHILDQWRPGGNLVAPGSSLCP